MHECRAKASGKLSLVNTLLLPIFGQSLLPAIKSQSWIFFAKGHVLLELAKIQRRFNRGFWQKVSHRVYTLQDAYLGRTLTTPVKNAMKVNRSSFMIANSSWGRWRQGSLIVIICTLSHVAILMSLQFPLPICSLGGIGKACYDGGSQLEIWLLGVLYKCSVCSGSQLLRLPCHWSNWCHHREGCRGAQGLDPHWSLYHPLPGFQAHSPQYLGLQCWYLLCSQFYFITNCLLQGVLSWIMN